jgi:cytochrome o ubiquinol oxidase subunit II
MRNSALRRRTPATGASSPIQSPTIGRFVTFSGRLLALGAAALLSGCSLALFNPKGDIGVQEKNLILLALGLMLLVVVPVILLTLYFAWRYRASNTHATYAPKWAHSTAIEIVVWTIPCVIVVILGLVIWRSTQSLDPSRSIESQVKPVRVEVVALNWKWLFIYPDYGVASVNQLAIPVDTPISFDLTAESLMNSFFIPQLGSQIYAMSGMRTQLNLIANSPGVYAGQSAAYSGAGFSDMHFNTIATNRADFDAWIARAKQSPLSLDKAAYQALTKPSQKDPVTVYARVTPGLFENVVDQYMKGAAHDPMCGTAKTALTVEPARAQLPVHQAAE